ncbi:MAG: hypothetical protein KJP14_03450 [Eudoraea sp.]|nr:hypothetical protein [Eudoraea sp.]MBT8209560.1 hypothetical protein [Eudoraea sp.]
MMILIIFIGGLWFSHYLIPDGVKSYWLGPLKIHSNGFTDASTFLWYSSKKFVMIILLVLWFFSTYNWWRYALLSPIILYMYQFWESFQDINSLDAYGNVKVFPLVFLSVLLVLAFSHVVRLQSRTLDTYEEISIEIDRLIKKLGKERSGVGDYRNRYQKILDRLVHSKSEEAQLAELTRLQQELRGKII